YLKESLPEYMVPSYFVKLDKMPTTSNGKLDRRSLPEPNLDVTLTEYEAPRNKVEETLAKIWSEILGIERIGINDSFFEIGGHSLKAVQVVSLIQKEFGIKISLKDIYNSSNISSLSKAIRISKNYVAIYNEIVPLPKQESYDLSYAQKRLWILNQLQPNSPAYNMSECFTLFEEVNANVIQNIFNILIQRHDAFRTRFKDKDGVVVQIIDENANFNIDKEDLSILGQEEKNKERKRIYDEIATKIFNLEEGPLIHIKLVKLAYSEYDLIYCMHHIISDGWSLEVLKKEFLLLYEAHKQGREYELEPLKIQYKDFASWQNKLIENKEMAQPAKAFWQKQLRGEVPILKLPVDYIASSLNNRESRGYRIVLAKDKKDKLKELAQENGVSFFVVMITTFKFFLSDLTKQRDILIGTATFGREHADLQNVIGYFINTTILRNEINAEESFTDLLQRINKNTLFALEYQSYPLELIVDELKIKYPKISAFFNMLNMGESTREYINDFNCYHIDKVQDIKFELVWYVTEYANGIEIMCDYLLGLFEPLTIEYMMKRYMLLLDKVLTDHNKLLKEYVVDKKKRKL
uniref:condensation domain-containing protein n=1 Tax=Clostridium sp. UBA6640 TaxID=1946370 RepID=UPI0025C6780D